LLFHLRPHLARLKAYKCVVINAQWRAWEMHTHKRFHRGWNKEHSTCSRAPPSCSKPHCMPAAIVRLPGTHLNAVVRTALLAVKLQAAALRLAALLAAAAAAILLAAAAAAILVVLASPLHLAGCLGIRPLSLCVCASRTSAAVPMLSRAEWPLRIQARWRGCLDEPKQVAAAALARSPSTPPACVYGC